MVFGDWKKYLSGAKKDLSADDRRILPYSDVERLFRENRQAEGAGFLREKSAGASFDPEIDFRKLAVPAVGWELRDAASTLMYGQGQIEVLLAKLLDAHKVCMFSARASLQGRVYSPLPQFGQD